MKTAVEWLINQLDGENHLTENEIKRVIEQAKEMEKEQICDAYLKNHLQGCWMDKTENEFAEEYYNETFKSE